jgi:aryl-alcohol dehydrogenase-like predicted oxidoreductase
MGMGCWPIGGYFKFCGKVDGYSGTNDQDSVHAIMRAMELGCTFFDTADVYGAGHSEEVLGRAFKGRRKDIVVQTKFGFVFDPVKKDAPGISDLTPAYIRKACEDSLRRLQTDYIDVYMCHVYEIKPEEMPPMIDTLEMLKFEGKIREFGWSTGIPEQAEKFAANSSAADFEFGFNVLKNSREEKEMIKICEQYHMACIAHSALAMGFLSGKFDINTKIGPDDVRGSGYDWCVYFEDGRPKKEFLDKLDAVRQVLTSDGRSLVQGAIAWIWAQSDCLIPITGVKNMIQAEENFRAMEYGPLTKCQLEHIDAILNQ